MGIIGYHWVCHWVRVSSGVIGCHRVVVGSVFIEIVKKSIKIMKIIRKIIEFIKNHSKSLKIFKIIANHYIFRFPNAISVKSLNFDCRAFPTGEFDCRSPPKATSIAHPHGMSERGCMATRVGGSSAGRGGARTRGAAFLLRLLRDLQRGNSAGRGGARTSGAAFLLRLLRDLQRVGPLDQLELALDGVDLVWDLGVDVFVLFDQHVSCHAFLKGLGLLHNHASEILWERGFHVRNLDSEILQVGVLLPSHWVANSRGPGRRGAWRRANGAGDEGKAVDKQETRERWGRHMEREMRRDMSHPC